jgi:hypothetical protein
MRYFLSAFHIYNIYKKIKLALKNADVLTSSVFSAIVLSFTSSSSTFVTTEVSFFDFDFDFFENTLLIDLTTDLDVELFTDVSTLDTILDAGAEREAFTSGEIAPRALSGRPKYFISCKMNNKR